MDAGFDHLQLRGPRGAVALGYVAEETEVFLIARERAAQWPVDALRAGSVELTIDGARRSGRIRLITDPAEKQVILDRFRRKYGDEGFRRWYERPARVLRVELGDGEPASPNPYDGWLRDEFDNVADDYDHHITGNRMNRLLRDRSLAELRATFRGARTLLEVGCGSGMETIPLLREGRTITVVDISDRMLDVVRAKARAEGRSEQLRTYRLRAAEIRRLVPELGVGSMDGAYSTFGAMNCEPELRPIATGFGGLVRAGGSLVLGVYNRWCLFELAGYTITGQAHRALGRRRNPIPVGASRFCVDVFAYSPWDVEAAFRPEFSRRRLEGVPVVLPPSDLTGYAEKFSRHFEALARWDAFIGRRFGFRGLGDHFLMTLERSGAPVGS